MKILILIDVQNGFNKNYYTRTIIQNIPKLIQDNNFDKIIMTKYINTKDSNISNILGWKKMTSEDEINFSVNLDSYNPKVFTKNTYSCVNDELVNFLNTFIGNNTNKKIYLAGFDTDCCVLFSAIDFLEKGYTPYILLDYCASSGGYKFHIYGLRLLERMVGKKHIITSTNID